MSEQLFARGVPIYPKTECEKNKIPDKVRELQSIIEYIVDAVENRLLKKTEIAEWAKQPLKPIYTATETGADPDGSAEGALNNAKAYADSTYTQATGYTDTKIADLINGAPSTLDTLGEIANAMVNNKNVVDVLADAIGTKANEVEAQAHYRNETVHVKASEREKWNKLNDKLLDEIRDRQSVDSDLQKQVDSKLSVQGGEVYGNTRFNNASIILTKGFNLFFDKDYTNYPNIGADYRDLKFNSGIVGTDLRFAVLNGTWTFCPTNTNVKLGHPSYRWGEIYSTTATISTSDRREKGDIRIISYDEIKDFLNELTPVYYRLLTCKDKMYAGLIAQEVEAAMIKHNVPPDFGLLDKQPKYDEYGKPTGDYIYGLCYEQLTALMLVVLQHEILKES